MLRFAFYAASVLSVLCLSACSSDQEKPPNAGATGAGPTVTVTTPPTTATPPATTTSEPPPPNPAARWVGSYQSPSCADRKYERLVSLRDNGSFNGEDRVSPCPQGVQCIWSGIVMWQGRFEVTDTQVVLTRTDTPAGGPAGAAKIDNPLRLEIDMAKMQLVEVRGGERCPYTRAASSPAEKR